MRTTPARRHAFVLARALTLLTILTVTPPSPAQARPPESAREPAPNNRIDDLVFARLRQLNIQPAPLSSDAVFLRRAYLDVIGTLPSAQEARSFLADQSPDKRGRLIESLLGRDEFGDYWAMKWCDILRVKSEFPIKLWPNAVQAYYHWIRATVRDNMPYDQFARELLTESGSNFRVPPVNFYRAVQSREPRTIAAAAALTFMGTRTDAWPKDRLDDLAAFFSQVGYKQTQEWKEEIVFFDPGKAFTGSRVGAARMVVFPDGTTAKLAPDQDPREAFAQWLTAPDNPWFAKALVNRVWSWLLGRGIVHEPDDIRPDNPPVNPELLAFLEKEFTGSRFDLKQLFRLILNSATYQMSSGAGRPEDEANFAHYRLRMLDAEVLIDAINQITGASEPYSSAIPEPFTFTPPNQRAIALEDGSITSAFLETFGRPKRDTGLESERNAQPTAAAALALLNSSQIQRKFDSSAKLQALIQARVDLRQAITNLYLTVLSRFPTEEEVRVASGHAEKEGGARRVFGMDLAWALVNSEEFLFRH